MKVLTLFATIILSSSFFDIVGQDSLASHSPLLSIDLSLASNIESNRPRSHPSTEPNPQIPTPNTQSLELTSKMTFSGRGTLLGSSETPSGEFVYNRRNEILFAPGLPYSVTLQWFFHANALWSIKADPLGFHYTIPEAQIAKDLHRVMLNHSTQSSIDSKYPIGGSLPGGSRKINHGPPVLPGVRIPGQIHEDNDTNLSRQDSRGNPSVRRPGFPKPTLNGGLILSQSQLALNSLSPLETQIREQGQSNHTVQILAVSLDAFHNPLPFSVGVQWEKNEASHREHSGDESYLFVLEPNTTTTLNPPRTWDLRPSLSTHDLQFSAMYKRHKSMGLVFDSDNQRDGNINVYSKRILGIYIKNQYKDIEFEETIWRGEPVIIVKKALADEAHKALTKSIDTVKFVEYRNFKFNITPLLDVNRGGGQCLPPGTSKEGLIRSLFEQQYPRCEIEKLIQNVSASITIRYL